MRRSVVDSDYRPLTITIGHAALEGAFRALTGSSRQLAFRFDPALSTSSGTGARIQRLISFIVDELEHDDAELVSSLVGTRYAEALMFEMLEGLAHNHRTLLATRAQAAEPRYVRRAAEWLEANAAEPISMVMLSKVIGMSVRSLQVATRPYSDGARFRTASEATTPPPPPHRRPCPLRRLRRRNRRVDRYLRSDPPRDHPARRHRRPAHQLRGARPRDRAPRHPADDRRPAPARPPARRVHPPRSARHPRQGGRRAVTARRGSRLRFARNLIRSRDVDRSRRRRCTG